MAYLSKDSLSPITENRSNNLIIGSFNCRSVKSSVAEIHSLCEKCDLVCIQEHLLLPNELSFLSSIHPNFLSVGYSAVDITSDTLVGRLYGGTGILYISHLVI